VFGVWCLVFGVCCRASINSFLLPSSTIVQQFDRVNKIMNQRRTELLSSMNQSLHCGRTTFFEIFCFGVTAYHSFGRVSREFSKSDILD
jgi:hypothetical protein